MEGTPVPPTLISRSVNVLILSDTENFLAAKTLITRIIRYFKSLLYYDSYCLSVKIVFPKSDKHFNFFLNFQNIPNFLKILKTLSTFNQFREF